MKEVEQDKRKLDVSYYKIADHLIGVYAPVSLELERYLPSFMNFMVDVPSNAEDRIEVEIRTTAPEQKQGDRQLLSDISQQWGDRFRFEESNQTYITSVRYEGRDSTCEMHSAKDFRKSIIYFEEPRLEAGSVLSWLLMVVYAQAVLPYKMMVIHASVVYRQQEGFAFLGKSGTGKSTHSRLWLQSIEGTQLLNDDNPIVRIDEDGKIWIYGSPWSGKTACYRNLRVELKGLVRLRQAKHNVWTDIDGKSALLAILPSCSSIRWDRNLYSKMVDVAERLIGNVRVAYLDCLPNREAAYLCNKKLNETNTLYTEAKTQHYE
ncbi:hypothetical protein [Albibacterium indicum]|uniref:hypothetical protein n=1 Tax=Albibacterium indicum TaxID=2292082 RepID=UPI000E5094C6|nr:hypothetical protein [Pedobacter indicus]